MNILSTALEFLIKVCVPLHATVFVCGKKCEFGYSMIPYIMDVIWKWVVDVIFHS